LRSFFRILLKQVEPKRNGGPRWVGQDGPPPALRPRPRMA